MNGSNMYSHRKDIGNTLITINFYEFLSLLTHCNHLKVLNLEPVYDSMVKVISCNNSMQKHQSKGGYGVSVLSDIVLVCHFLSHNLNDSLFKGWWI